MNLALGFGSAGQMHKILPPHNDKELSGDDSSECSLPSSPDGDAFIISSRQQLSEVDDAHRRHQVSKLLNLTGSESGKQKSFRTYMGENLEQYENSLSLPLVPFVDTNHGLISKEHGTRKRSCDMATGHHHGHRRPLIDFAHNELPKEPSKNPSSPNDEGIPQWIQTLSTPRFRRYGMIGCLMLMLLWVYWRVWGEAQWEEHVLLSNALKGKYRPGQSAFGTNMRSAFHDMIHIKTLDQALIPRKGAKERLIVVGDVHGCVDECESGSTTMRFVFVLTKYDRNLG